jgi:hypothetical protein
MNTDTTRGTHLTAAFGAITVQAGEPRMRRSRRTHDVRVLDRMGALLSWRPSADVSQRSVATDS